LRHELRLAVIVDRDELTPGAEEHGTSWSRPADSWRRDGEGRDGGVVFWRNRDTPGVEEPIGLSR
jgi:hypothetical protein